METSVDIPEGVTGSISGKAIEATGPLGTLGKDLSFMPLVSFSKSGDKVVIRTPRDKKNDKKFLHTARAHVRNVLDGVTKGYRYVLDIYHVHFPLRVAVQGEEIVVSNFLGSKTERRTRGHPDVKVRVQGKQVLVEGLDKELVGQVASRIEQLTKVKGHDRRVFKDGVFLTKRGYMNE